MNGRGQVFTLPSYDAIPAAEHGPTLKWVLEVCQGQQKRLVLLEEMVAQLKDEIAILKGEKPRPRTKPSTLTKETPPGEAPARRDRTHDKQAKELEIHETRLLEPAQLPVGGGLQRI